MTDAAPAVPLLLCHNDSMTDPAPELQAAAAQHTELKRLEADTRTARLELGRRIAAARAAGVPQKDLVEQLGENRETLRRWQREYEDTQKRAAS